NEIAYQKAGIIKPGVPVVSGVVGPGPRDVIEQQAAAVGSPVDRLGRGFWDAAAPAPGGPPRPGGGGVAVGPAPSGGEVGRAPMLKLHPARREWPPLELKLIGPHQAANAAVAVGVVDRLQRCGVTIPDEAVHAGLKSVDWPARVEILGHRPTVVLDCAHN